MIATCSRRRRITVDETPDMIGADDVTKESGLDEPNVPGPGKDAQPEAPVDDPATEEDD
jgi:hypothetical protein